MSASSFDDLFPERDQEESLGENCLGAETQPIDSQFAHPKYLLHAHDIAMGPERTTGTQARDLIDALVAHAALAARIAHELALDDGHIAAAGFTRVRKDLSPSWLSVQDSIDRALCAHSTSQNSVSTSSCSPLNSGSTNLTAAVTYSGLDLGSLSDLLKDTLAKDLTPKLLPPLASMLKTTLPDALLDDLEHALLLRLLKSLQEPLLQTLRPLVDANTVHQTAPGQYRNVQPILATAAPLGPSYDPQILRQGTHRADSPLMRPSGFKPPQPLHGETSPVHGGQIMHQRASSGGTSSRKLKRVTYGAGEEAISKRPRATE
ncbi:hypothetical protein BN946_scf185037.g22 [Trametes cinnabarina]|uniref:Uncharacterized protein n=1 Tax=Pycnoporus cinnabarinus TaxID=5643 RepID=A0A060SVF4_PYCCI|nr:hypothetical protein BN946_scf185037.g22 [Trametes cinnabarina]